VEGDRIGDRIAAYRRRRGLSQAALAGLVGRSESWLSQVERGLRTVERLPVLLALARVLRVDVEALAGASLTDAGRTDPVDGLDQVREVMLRYQELVGQAAPHDRAEPAHRIDTLHRKYQQALYHDALLDLPDLIAAANTRDPETYLSTYLVAAKLLKKIGANDLAWIAADRAAASAGCSGSQSARGLAACQVASVLHRLGYRSQAEIVAVRTAESLQRHLDTGDPLWVSVTGALWLLAAVIAARQADSDAARERLDAAGQMANLLGIDANYGYTAFGPTNVAIHRVSVAAELGDAAEAARLAEYVRPTGLPPALVSRRAQVNLDLAWAFAQRKNDAKAVLYLLDTEQIASGLIRYNAVAKDLVRQMLARHRRGPIGALQGLAERAGVLA
jgi:transcriptional regulator with XRE-family HTH domain